MMAHGLGLGASCRAETWAAEVPVLSGAEPGTVPGLRVSAGDGALSPEVTRGALTAQGPHPPRGQEVILLSRREPEILAEPRSSMVAIVSCSSRPGSGEVKTIRETVLIAALFTESPLLARHCERPNARHQALTSPVEHAAPGATRPAWGSRLVAEPESRPRALKLTVFLADCVAPFQSPQRLTKAHLKECPEVRQGPDQASINKAGQARLSLGSHQSPSETQKAPVGALSFPLPLLASQHTVSLRNSR